MSGKPEDDIALMRKNMQRNWRELIKPKRLEIDTKGVARYAKFECEPLERGFGITLGNALRRVLLSSLQGAAITSVKIDRVQHEFGSIPGVLEDVTDIILNLKEVRLKLNEEGPVQLFIEKEGEGEVSGADIRGGAGVEVLNPDHRVCTLAQDGRVRMELTARQGKGYTPADWSMQENQPIGAIPIDAVFSPVRKVRYDVSQARVGQITDYDKLTMEIWTDGSLKSEDALAYAAKILKEQLNVFINFVDYESRITPRDLEESLKRESERIQRDVRERLSEVRRVVSKECKEEILGQISKIK